jgi:carboxyl-terminal processing protease
MSEHGEGEKRSVTTDVAKLLAKLKTEKVQGIVVDLRRNGGGSLKEAISLTGLFIKKGPVVQTKAATGDVNVESDPDSSVLYDGPLVLVTSRFSASATEILAGALKDYGRALVVGDSQTFGKGTVQTILPLARIMDQQGLAHAYDPGALKITISKFYRPSGGSTQLRGVASDIVLPSTSDFSDVSESSLKNPLPWGTVPAAPYQQLNRVQPYLETVRQQSARRIATGKNFAILQSDIDRLKKSIASKTVSLNEAERRQEITQAKTRKSERDQELAALTSAQPKTYNITLKNAATAGLPQPGSAKDAKPEHPATPSDESNDGASVQKFADDLIENESVQILADYTELMHGGKPTAAASAPAP